MIKNGFKAYLMHITTGSVGIISTAREDWVPSTDSSAAGTREEIPEVFITTKEQRDNETLDSVEFSQADWIRRYMEQQEVLSSVYFNDKRNKKVGFLLENTQDYLFLILFYLFLVIHQYLSKFLLLSLSCRMSLNLNLA